MKYIDADKLVAEIERWRDKAKENYNESTYSMGRCDALAEFRNYMVSLLEEQPEIDLDEEIQEHLKECLDVKFPTTDIELIKQDVAYTARKFYELGFNARKENTK